MSDDFTLGGGINLHCLGNDRLDLIPKLLDCVYLSNKPAAKVLTLTFVYDDEHRLGVTGPISQKLTYGMAFSVCGVGNEDDKQVLASRLRGY